MMSDVDTLDTATDLADDDLTNHTDDAHPTNEWDTDGHYLDTVVGIMVTYIICGLCSKLCANILQTKQAPCSLSLFFHHINSLSINNCSN